MLSKKNHRCFALLVLKSLVLGIFLMSFVAITLSHARIILDGSMGTPGELSGPSYVIGSDLGRIRGRNLFHSFGRFDVLKGESATFRGPDTIENVIGRVTWTQSYIDGLLRCDINRANLFLINPHGVVFGENASLDVSGSFHVSTADYIGFEGGERFYAQPDAARDSLLSVASPEAFGFLGSNPKGISVKGSVLKVKTGKTLSLIGGDIDITGGSKGFISAPGGRLNIASVASPGEVIPGDPGELADLRLNSFERLGTINTFQTAFLNAGDAGGSSAGTILIRGGRLIARDSYILSNNLSDEDGARSGIDINMREEINLGGTLLQSAALAEGRSGDILVTAPAVQVKNGSTIETLAWSGSGDGGNIEVGADNLEVSHRSFIRAQTYSSGHGGDININTGSMRLEDYGQIYANPSSTGDSGDLTVVAKEIFMSGKDTPTHPAYLGTQTREGSSGHGGDLRLTVDTLQLWDGAMISVSTYGSGDGGSLDLNAQNILLSGVNTLGGVAGIFGRSFGSGDAGRVGIRVNDLYVMNGAQISTTAYGEGNGADLYIAAKNMLLTPYDLVSGTNPGRSTGIFSRGFWGDGGDTLIETKNLGVLDGAVISSSSMRSGAGGNITVAAEHILLSGVNKFGNRAGIFSQSNSDLATGPAGDVHIKAGSLEVKDGAQITVAALGPGGSGNLEINAGSMLVSGVDLSSGLSARISGNTYSQAKGGNLHITSDSLQVKDGGAIEATTFASGDAGSIDIKAKQVEVSGVDSASGKASHIRAQAVDDSTGNAGHIRIATESLKVYDGAEIAATTFGLGSGGYIDINAKSIVLDAGRKPEKGVGLFAASHGSGDAGDIRIKAESLEMVNGAQVATVANGSGNGGAIEVNARRILLSGAGESMVDNEYSYTALLARTHGSGRGGDIRINAQSLEVMDGAAIDCRTFSSGEGGNIYVDANSVLIHGSSSNGLLSSITADSEGTLNDSGSAGSVYVHAVDLQVSDRGRISSQTLGPGAGGDVKMEVDRLEVSKAGQISTSSWGAGKAGDIHITANEYLHSDRSSITTAADKAKGGNITLRSRNILISNGSLVSAESSGAGDAGNIDIAVTDTFLAGNSVIRTEARHADGGNIGLKGRYMIRLVDSEISSSVGGGADTIGGNITIDPEFVILNKSRIIANAFEGRGGNIDITAGAFLADPSSLVSASSERGINGTVDIRAPITSISESLNPLTKDFAGATELLREPCEARIRQGKGASLVISGRDGLSIEPGGLLPSPM